MKKSNWQIIFIAIIFVRVLLFIFPSFHIDMGTWEVWSYRLINLGFSNFYSKDFYTEYFPGFLYFLWLIGHIYHFLFPNLSFSSFQFEIVLKIVTTIFDLGTSLLIYKIVKRLKPKFAYLSAVLYFSNPAVIFNASIWGQIDGIYTFFLLLSSYLLIEKLKPIKSIFFSSIALVMKPQAIFFLPVLFSDLIKNSKSRIFFYSIIFLIIFSLAQVFPFFPLNPIQGFIQVTQRSINLYPYTSLFAFNFWGILGLHPWHLDSQIFILSLKTWGIIMYGLSLVAILLPILKKNKDKSQLLYLSFALSFFSSFLFLTRMHERYLFPVLAFYLIYAIYKRKLLIIYFLISFIHFLNLWYVYYYYNFVYNFRIEPNALYKFIDNFHNIFSALLIGSFFFILVSYYGFSKKTT